LLVGVIDFVQLGSVGDNAGQREAIFVADQEIESDREDDRVVHDAGDDAFALPDHHRGVDRRLAERDGAITMPTGASLFATSRNTIAAKAPRVTGFTSSARAWTSPRWALTGGCGSRAAGVPAYNRSI
jgi:hypothetical protein